MSAELEYSSYSSGGHDELCLQLGASHKRQIALIPPLFDEMNKMRRLLLDIMRQLDTQNIGTILPDLPGTNESLQPQDSVNFQLWRAALEDCLSQHDGVSHIAAFRGSCLIDNLDANYQNWRLAPVNGNSLLRTMMRTRIASDKESGRSTTIAELTEQARTSTLNLAGNCIGPKFFTDLEAATASEATNLRTARLATDGKTADVKLAGSALWLRAEPDEDPILAEAIAKDLAQWCSR